MPTLTVPAPLRTYTANIGIIELQAVDVRGAVQELVSQFPALDSHLFTEQGHLKPYVNLFLNGEDVRYLQGLDTELAAQDQLRIIPSIAGGV